MAYSFLVLNGPNLGCLGKRQPEIYGHTGLSELPGIIGNFLSSDLRDKISLDFYQSNHEGALIDRLEQAWRENIVALVINAGALTHTSLALADCLAWIKIPFVEVHISNVLAREEQIRHQSLIGRYALGIIAGFGLLGYALGVRALYDTLFSQKNTLR